MAGSSADVAVDIIGNVNFNNHHDSALISLELLIMRKIYVWFLQIMEFCMDIFIAISFENSQVFQSCLGFLLSVAYLEGELCEVF